MKTTNFVTSLANTGLVSYAGLAAVARFATCFNLPGLINTALTHPIPSRKHTIGDSLTALAVAHANGLYDLYDVTNLQPLVTQGLVDTLPSVTTVHRHLHTLAACNDSDMVILGALRQLYKQFFALYGIDLWAQATPDTPLIIDIDASELPVHSDKDGAAPTWKRHFGFNPLIAMLHLPQFGIHLPLDVLLRPGNAGNNTAADHIRILTRALYVLGIDLAAGFDAGGAIVVRTDTGGGTYGFMHFLVDHGLGFITGIPADAAIPALLGTGNDHVRIPVDRADMTCDLDTAYLVDLTDTYSHHIPQRYARMPATARIYARVEYPAAGCQLRLTDINGRRIQTFATTTTVSIQYADIIYRARGNVERAIQELKSFGVGRLPAKRFATNQVYAHTSMLAMAMTKLLLLATAWADSPHLARSIYCRGMAPHGPSWLRWHIDTLRTRILHLAGKTTKHARQLHLRIDPAAPWAHLAVKITTTLGQLKPKPG